jgi:putative ABC transport system permease protein
MSILNKFTVKNLKLNKKRTIVTIIGIMLSTALICGVAGLVSSFKASLINWIKVQDGNYHVAFHDIPVEKLKYVSENQKVKDYYLVGDVGWANLNGSTNDYKPYVHILEYDNKALNNLGVNLTEGRLPEKSNEIVISEHIITNGRVILKVGDEITLDVGKRVSSDGEELNENNPLLNENTLIVYDDETDLEERETEEVEETEHIENTTKKTYKIVGIMQRLSREDFSSPGYIVITHMDKIPEKIDISVLYKNPKEYEEIAKDICKTFGIMSLNEIDINTELLRFEGVMSENMMNVLYTIAGVIIAIIVVSSVFVIRNSFSISVAEKNRQYGMLASIGATSKQIKRNVIFEGMIIGLIAIPLGIILGIVAIMILLQVVNYLLVDMLNNLSFIYSINPLAIVCTIVISLITIYLSCLIPAIRASKISPIESIRGNKDIKIKAKKLRTSRLTKKIFGIGGVIASKNLKRSKKKYRTTVISLVVSIFIFISLSSILNLGTKVTGLYYKDFKFNMYVSYGTEEIYEELVKQDNVDNYAYYYQTSLDFEGMKYASEFGKDQLNAYGDNMISLVAYNNEYFKNYIKELGLNPEDYKTVALLQDDEIRYNDDGSKTIDRLYKIKPNDKIEVGRVDKTYNITISKCTADDSKPMGQEVTYYHDGVIIVSEDFVKEVFGEDVENSSYMLSNLLINSKHPQELENTLNDLIKVNTKYTGLEVTNYDTYIDQQRRMVLVVKIFLYGFISVITLIGVTNIFNTITTNMILRSKEFAMLKSIGMSKKEFNKMIRLESIMYGAKSLLIGIPLGILGSYGVYKAFAQGVDVGYMIPYPAIIISIVFVFIIVGITMKYSLDKINKQNIIETIRKDNI